MLFHISLYFIYHGWGRLQVLKMTIFPHAHYLHRMEHAVSLIYCYHSAFIIPYNPIWLPLKSYGMGPQSNDLYWSVITLALCTARVICCFINGSHMQAWEFIEQFKTRMMCLKTRPTGLRDS